MIFTPYFLHYLSAGLAICLSVFGAGIGLGIAGFGTLSEMMRQPLAYASSFRAMLIGLALIESGAIITLVLTVILLIGTHDVVTWSIALAELGTALAVGLAAATISLASSFVVKAAISSIAREPHFSQRIITIMLVTQSIIEAPVMFAFIIGLIIRYNITDTIELAESLKLFSIGLSMGIGCIGPSIGQAMLASTSCFSVGLFKNSYSRIFPFTLLGQAVIETPVAFSLLFSIILIYTPLPIVQDGGSVLGVAVPFVVAAILLSIASLGPGIGMGFITSKSVRQVAEKPSLYQPLVKSMLVSCAFLEASLIYALIIGLFMITGGM